MTGFRALLIALVIVLVAYAGGLLTVNRAPLDEESVPAIGTQKENQENSLASTTPTKNTEGVAPIIEKKVSKKETTAEMVGSVKIPLPAPPLPPVDFEKINGLTREALVNIICVPKEGSLSASSGSGIIVDKKGVILTNAHIAQYFLLPDLVTCTVRTGSPATAKYEATLLYIPSAWVEKNAPSIVTENPQGTGENDYAFLLISKALNGDVLPKEFSYLSLETLEVRQGEVVLVAGYPAGFLGGFTIFNSLYAVSSVVTVVDIFTFFEKTVDLFSVGGNPLAQKGSSGGAVVNTKNNLLGIIATATSEAQTKDRDLRAISSGYILRNFSENKKISLDDFLQKDLLFEVQLFKDGEYLRLSSLLKDKI